jgi:hypothetical protein
MFSLWKDLTRQNFPLSKLLRLVNFLRDLMDHYQIRSRLLVYVAHSLLRKKPFSICDCNELGFNIGLLGQLFNEPKNSVNQCEETSPKRCNLRRTSDCNLWDTRYFKAEQRFYGFLRNRLAL